MQWTSPFVFDSNGLSLLKFFNMKSLAERKIAIIQEILEIEDVEILIKIEKILNAYQISENARFISEPQSIYNSEKPMTEEEVEAYFKEEKIVLPPEILEILKVSEEDIKAGRIHTNDEIEAYFDEWLKD